jgi:hypothetical protein
VLSDVGQSYGPVATILSGAALIGIVATLILQSKQTRLIAEQAVRQTHLEIMREAWADPELLQALEVIPDGRHELARRFLFVNTFFMNLRMGWRSGQVSLAEIEDIAAHSFSTSAGTFYWKRVEPYLQRHFEPQYVGALGRGYARAQVRAEGAFLDGARDFADVEAGTLDTAEGDRFEGPDREGGGVAQG